MDLENPELIVSRWQGADQGEHSFQVTGNYHILAISLKPSRFSLWLGKNLFPHDKVAPGLIQITPPGLLARVVYFEPYDILHLHIPNSLLIECLGWSSSRTAPDRIILKDPLPRDALLQRLASALRSVKIRPNDSLFSDFLSLSIVARLLHLQGEVAHPANRKTTALPKWRLKRAVEFIEAHLDCPVALADVAGAAGLSRMHFAAQFRAATGIRPHEYVLRRRVEKAQTMLATTDTPIVELALSVGFCTQAHFTAVFKRFSGQTPNRWRQSHRM